MRHARLSLLDGCTLVNFAFSSLQLQRQRQPSSSQATNAGEEESESSPNSEIIVPDYTVDSGATNQIGSTVVVVDLLRRFPSDLIETSVDPEPLLAGMGNDTEMAAAASAARVNKKNVFVIGDRIKQARKEIQWQQNNDVE